MKFWDNAKGSVVKILRGITWDHDRGLRPLVETATRFGEIHPDVSIKWEARSLGEFGEAPVEVLADHYDLIVLDHPFVGLVAQKRCYIAYDEHLDAIILGDLASDSTGLSYASYQIEGHQWAMAIDAAAHVSGFRPDLLAGAGVHPPSNWAEVFDLAAIRPGFVSLALSPLDALLCFFTLCANAGDPPFASGEDKLVSHETAEYALEILRRLASQSVPEALSMNPIAMWERMSRSDDIAYCPLAFGYSNYSRKGYRANLVLFGTIPSAGQGPSGATLGGTGLAISRSCRHLEIALEYSNWVAGRKCQSTYYVESGGQPARKSAWLDESANRLTCGYFAATLSVLEQAWLRPRYDGFVRHQASAANLIHRFLRNEMSSKDVLQALDSLDWGTAGGRQ